MKKKNHILIVCVMLCFGAFSCKSSKSTATTAKVTSAENYRLVISFISIGTGIDGDSHDAIKKFIADHAKKPAVETFRWGREGEVDYCLQLKELSSKEQKAFVEEIKKLAGKSELVQISENAPCVHKK